MTRAESRYFYRCYGDGDRLLYVGITSNVESRIATHRRSWWGHHLRRVDVTDYVTGVAARRVEREAIANDGPRFNRQGRWADRSSWTAGDYRDYYDATRFGPSSSHRAPRMEQTRAECLNRYGIDVTASDRSYA